MTESDHFNGRRFVNPRISGDKSLRDLLRWAISGQRKKWPVWVENKRHPGWSAPLQSDQAAVTFINHSSFLVQFCGFSLLTDPIFSKRASPVSWAGPKRVRPPGIALAELPAIHLVLLSHNHYDHMDLASLRTLAEKFDPLILTPLGNGRLLRRHGISRVIELDWWQSHQVDNKTRATATPAQHFSSRSLFDRDRALWAGFVIEHEGVKVYFAGDSGYEKHFCEIGRRFDPISLALIPIGAYEPRWFMKPVHMNPGEAVQAHIDLGTRQSLAMHFGTFHLTDEGIDEPLVSLRENLQSKGIDLEQFKALEFGETLILNGR
ncbi:MAG: hypothetical protein JWR26_3645 [Pedosphaera sp.]|nr:hypothetical protein [Pedosphaera sp.]